MGTGRHPSRTLILVPTDPDGPAWLRADVKAYCMTPRADGPETCAEHVYVTAGGDTGRHLEAIVAPLLVHDLPVTVWWPGDPPFGTALANALVETADRLVVDGSRWSGDGLDRLRALAALARPALPISDFALMRQARWREAVASVFDRPGAPALPAVPPADRGDLRDARRTGHGGGDQPGQADLPRGVAGVPARAAGSPAADAPSGDVAEAGRDLGALLARERRADTEVLLRPVVSPAPSGTTLRVELLAERRASELRVEVTAEAESVRVRALRDGVEALDRTFHAARRTDADLLTEAIEADGRDPVAEGTLASGGAAGAGGAGGDAGRTDRRHAAGADA